MEGDFIKIRETLLPLSWLYGAAVRLRNFCFDVGILKSRAFPVPVISVGNITVGGTGKTPHVEFLIRLLRDKFNVAVLSRGYKRKKKGYIKADENATARDIGDEPMQMKTKFNDITVAVDKKRMHGILQLTNDDEKLDVVLLDDAYQHRYVKPGVNILLVDYHRLIIYDKLLPAGRLREPLRGKDRADIVIVTKCPKELKPMEFRVITKAMNLYPFQHLYFSTMDYDTPYPLFNAQPAEDMTFISNKNVLLLTAIASPRQMEEDIENNYHPKTLTSLAFPDHHAFKAKDIDNINQAFLAMDSPKIILTTEKDAERLRNAEGLDKDVIQQLYVMPVRVRFMQKEQEEKFGDFIIGYVRKNSRNSILTKGKEESKPQATEKKAKSSRTISFRNN